MQIRPLLSTILFLLCGISSTDLIAQDRPDCCSSANCRDQAAGLAARIAGITVYLGQCDDPNDTTAQGPFRELNLLKATRPAAYEDLLRAVREADRLFFGDNRQYGDSPCFTDALPPDPFRSITLCWINFIRFNVLGITPRFPSTEFCRGWSRRWELNQGASSFLSKSSMRYLASLRAYISYTFKKYDSSKVKQCGGRFRISAGPGLTLHQTDWYLLLHTRAAIRITDLQANVFRFGNLNAFAGYNSNFRHFQFAELGLEAEIGPIGFNLSANLNTQNGKAGFGVGILFANKKF